MTILINHLRNDKHKVIIFPVVFYIIYFNYKMVLGSKSSLVGQMHNFVKKG